MRGGMSREREEINARRFWDDFPAFSSFRFFFRLLRHETWARRQQPDSSIRHPRTHEHDSNEKRKKTRKETEKERDNGADGERRLSPKAAVRASSVRALLFCLMKHKDFHPSNTSANYCQPTPAARPPFEA